MWGNHFELFIFKSSTLHSHGEFLFSSSPPLSFNPLPFSSLSFFSFVDLSPVVQCTASVSPQLLPLEHQFSCLSHGFQGGTAGHGILPLWLWLTQWASFPRIFQSLALKPAASCASNGPPYNSLQLGPFFPLPLFLPPTDCSPPSSQRNLFSETSFKPCQFYFRFLFWICHPIPDEIQDFLHFPLAPSFHLQPLSSYHCQSVPHTGQTHTHLRAFAHVLSSP